MRGCRLRRPARTPAARRNLLMSRTRCSASCVAPQIRDPLTSRVSLAPDQQRIACAAPRPGHDTFRASKESTMAPAPVMPLHPDVGVLIASASVPAGLVVADGVTTL